MTLNILAEAMCPLTTQTQTLFFQIEKENGEENIKLRVPVSKRTDTGKYTVALKNDFGEDTGDISVTVLGMCRSFDEANRKDFDVNFHLYIIIFVSCLY